MVNRGRRAKPRWTKGDRVLVEFDGEFYAGVIAGLTKQEATVDFDDGDTQGVPLSDLKPEATTADDEGSGFQGYPIDWKGTNFSAEADGHRFHGCWRRTKFWGAGQGRDAYAIDIWAKYKGHHYSVRSIPYLDKDPRADLRSLNADICAAISQFLYERESIGMPSIEALRRKAMRPIVHVSSIETLDRIILHLKEVRDTAIRSGGVRMAAIQGDKKNDPIVGLQIDVTKQALILEGRVPSLETGAIADVAIGGSGRAIKREPDIKNVRALCERLERSTDKSEQRKLRAALRRMGHTGGLRALKKKLEKEQGNA